MVATAAQGELKSRVGISEGRQVLLSENDGFAVTIHHTSFSEPPTV